MATSSIAAPVPRRISFARDWVAAHQLAGIAFFAAGVIVFMGITTAESLYPLTDTTSGNEISDLGGTRPPAGLVFQPSATIFNTAMLLAGVLTTIGSVAAHRVFGSWLLTLSALTLGICVSLVAIFPGNTGAPHAVSAMVAFFAGGFAVVFSSRLVKGPYRFTLLALGTVTLSMLASYFLLGDNNPMWALGVGGAERWVAYPEILWMLGFGGYVAGTGELREDRGREASRGISPAAR
jgi:hypothetical membrane protein